MLKNFVGEIKTRKIRKWLAIHLSTSLTLIGAVNLLSSRYGIPSYIFDSIFILAICALPITLVLAWFHGTKQQRAFRTGEIVFYCIIIFLAGFILYRLIFTKMEKTIDVVEKSIAVLPFQNFSDSKDDEYFSDGITDDILTQLSKVRALKVISRTSVMKYKNTQKTAPEIAKELGVESILEGSVRRSGSRIRIVGQLIDAVNDKHLWAEKYDRQLKDIFTIQSEVAEKIASALAIKLTFSEKENIHKKYTESIDAYTLYLKGKDYYYRLTPEDNETAVKFFKEALTSDPNYALAYAGLGKAYAQKFRIFGMGDEWYDSSKAMIEKAIELDPDIAEPYLALGLNLLYSGKIHYSLEQYLKAASINPNSDAVSAIGQIYCLLGNLVEAVPWLNQAIKLDPTDWVSYRSLGQIYYDIGRYNDAERLFLKVNNLMPEHYYALLDLNRLYIVQKQYEKADSLLLHTLSNNPENYRVLYCLAEVKMFAGKSTEAKLYFKKVIDIATIKYGPAVEYGYFNWKDGKVKEAKDIFAPIKKSNEEEIKEGMENYNYPYELARIYSIEGNKDKALENLKLAIKFGWKNYLYAKADPLLENIRNDSGFVLLIKDIQNEIIAMKSKIK
jgi:TolB-like protein/Flp pilus assembly protein TadD